MKIRIKGNTVRYRLSKSEVVALATNGLLEEETAFPGNALQYAIRQTTGAGLSADFSHNIITLYVPQAALQQWAATNQIGLDAHLPLPNGQTFYLLLEKDFKCMDADVAEDQSDYFENPHLTC